MLYYVRRVLWKFAIFTYTNYVARSIPDFSFTTQFLPHTDT